MNLSELFIEMGALITVIHFAVEAVRNKWIFKRLSNRVIALLIGLIAGTVAYLIRTPDISALGLEGWMEWLCLVMGGLGGAKLLHDSIWNPLRDVAGA